MTAGPEDRPAPLVLVTVGTDHHPFDRLVSWMDDWQRERGAERAQVLMQIGTSRTPAASEWVTYLEHDELRRLMTRAVAVVCHGGPGTIVDSLAAGKRPIVVPRTKALGEHVDDHQVRFAARLEDLGYAFVAEDHQRFEDLLTKAVDGAAAFSAPPLLDRTAASVDAFRRLVAERLSVSAVAERDG